MEVSHARLWALVSIRYIITKLFKIGVSPAWKIYFYCSHSNLFWKKSWWTIFFDMSCFAFARHYNSNYHVILPLVKVARYSLSGSIPPKFERKLRRHKQRLGKINTTVVLDKDENLLWSGLQWDRSCHSNEMTPLPILLAAVFLGTGNCSSKIVYWSFYLQ